ncbi:hypothetical protein ID866_5835 [Astraeus odoratus]|nr:hypothetical protein ID866_5835 [Astraeus odoratus]
MGVQGIRFLDLYHNTDRCLVLCVRRGLRGPRTCLLTSTEMGAGLQGIPFLLVARGSCPRPATRRVQQRGRRGSLGTRIHSLHRGCRRAADSEADRVYCRVYTYTR